MKLRELYLTEVVSIPGAIDIAGGTPVKREQSFHADDAWDLREVLPGIFSISRPDMPHAVTVGNIGYSYVPMPVDHAERERFEAAMGMQLQGDHGPIDVIVDDKAPPGGIIETQSFQSAAQYEQAVRDQSRHHRKGKR